MLIKKDVLILNARLADPRMNVSDMVVNLLDVLPLKGAQVNTFRSASRFQIAVGDGSKVLFSKSTLRQRKPRISERRIP